jgi:hypothetical protein
MSSLGIDPVSEHFEGKKKFSGLSLQANYTDPIDRRLSAKLMSTLVDRGCRMVRATNPYAHILGFLDQSRYFFFQVTPQLYSRG